jgi:hypothetical protein
VIVNEVLNRRQPDTQVLRFGARPRGWIVGVGAALAVILSGLVVMLLLRNRVDSTRVAPLPSVPTETTLGLQVPQPRPEPPRELTAEVAPAEPSSASASTVDHSRDNPAGVGPISPPRSAEQRHEGKAAAPIISKRKESSRAIVPPPPVETATSPSATRRPVENPAAETTTPSETEPASRGFDLLETKYKKRNP